MLKPLSVFISILFSFTSLLSALPASNQLKLAHVRNTMEEIFSYHFEAKEINQVLIKRSFKMFIEQFDPRKIYFLEEEVRPFLDLSSAQIEKVIDHFYVDRYPEFYALNTACIRAIERARKFRKDIYTEFTSKKGKIIDEDSDHSLQYLSSSELLKKRLRHQLFYLFLAENRFNDPNFWTLERRQKTCALIEKRFVRYENRYLMSREGEEHFLAMHILKAMARGLDAHTAFFSRDETFEIRSSLEKQFEGVGVILREGIDGVEVDALIKGGPADRSGRIQKGDVVIGINGYTPLGEDSYYEILDRLKGNGEKGINLSLKRKKGNGSETVIEVFLEREKILMDDERLTYYAEPFREGIIGVMSLPSFYESQDASSCERDIREALRALKQKGKLMGLVLDMRNNLGGFLNQAVRVAGLFISNGVVTISKYAQGEIQYFRNIDPRVYHTGPIVILVSKISASAAEIVAQALQDYGVALVVGDERTYGKGTIQYQTVTDRSSASSFKVTVGMYFTVSGKSTQITGVESNIVVPTSYTSCKIGERFLEYALKNDQVLPAYLDPLHDIPGQHKPWFQKNYIPYLQKKESVWVEMLPRLKASSSHRIAHDPEFQLFLKKVNDQFPVELSGGDIQLIEAVNIVKDMVNLK